MKILVLSDSHSSLRFMRDCANTVKPDVIIHLGDHFDDGEVLKTEYPNIRVYRVPGNCDRVFTLSYAPEVICCDISGVKFFITHGHRYGVKSGTSRLKLEARKAGARVVLYGHTHIAECEMEDDLLVLNPGSCRGYSGSAGMIEIENGKISSYRILRQEDIEEMFTINNRE